MFTLKNLAVMAIVAGLFLPTITTTAQASKRVVCGCWLTSYDYGQRRMGSETRQYRSGYKTCSSLGYYHGKAWIDGWRAGKNDRLNKGFYTGRNCRYFFSRNPEAK